MRVGFNGFRMSSSLFKTGLQESPLLPSLRLAPLCVVDMTYLQTNFLQGFKGAPLHPGRNNLRNLCSVASVASIATPYMIYTQYGDFITDCK